MFPRHLPQTRALWIASLLLLPVSGVNAQAITDDFGTMEELDREDEGSESVSIDGKPAVSEADSIVWEGDQVSDIKPLGSGVLEHKGERYGLIGPIVATGTADGNEVIAVYDSAGIFIGAISRDDAENDPEKLKALVGLAMERGVIQNQAALRQIGDR